MRILLVEDDPKMARLLRRGLEAEGHQVEHAADGAEAADRALSASPDLMLLDLSLPTLDGLEVLQRVRAVDLSLPVIVVTARSGVRDRVRGLDLGADDYLVKPFSFVELSARIRALLRRRGQEPARVLQIGDLSLDRIAREALCQGAREELSQREFQLLETLMRHVGEPLTRPMLAEEVWGHDFDTGTNVIEVYVNYVRRKLRTLGLEPIRTVRGVGYVLEEGRCSIQV